MVPHVTDVNIVIRKIASYLSLDKEILQDGTHFLIRTISTFRSYDMDFLVGEEFQEDLTGVDDRICMVRVHTHTGTCTHTHAHTGTRTHTATYTHTGTHTNAHTHRNIHTHRNTQEHTQEHTHLHIQTYISTHVHKRTCAHTHTQAHGPACVKRDVCCVIQHYQANSGENPLRGSAGF